MTQSVSVTEAAKLSNNKLKGKKKPKGKKKGKKSGRKKEKANCTRR